MTICVFEKPLTQEPRGRRVAGSNIKGATRPIEARWAASRSTRVYGYICALSEGGLIAPRPGLVWVEANFPDASARTAVTVAVIEARYLNRLAARGGKAHL